MLGPQPSQFFAQALQIIGKAATLLGKLGGDAAYLTIAAFAQGC